MTPTATAYEVAVEFIRLGDILRTFQRAGIEPSISAQQEMGECRYRLDLQLSERGWLGWDNAQWGAVVRDRLTNPKV